MQGQYDVFGSCLHVSTGSQCYLCSAHWELAPSYELYLHVKSCARRIFYVDHILQNIICPTWWEKFSALGCLSSYSLCRQSRFCLSSVFMQGEPNFWPKPDLNLNATMQAPPPQFRPRLVCLLPGFIFHCTPNFSPEGGPEFMLVCLLCARWAQVLAELGLSVTFALCWSWDEWVVGHLVFPVTIVCIFAVSLWHPLLVSQPVWTTTKMLSTVVEDNCVPNLWFLCVICKVSFVHWIATSRHAALHGLPC